MRSGEEIQAALRDFALRWRDYDGGERQGAQTFLNELATCYGTDLFAEGVKFEDPLVPGGFMDMYWRDRAVIEMKAPSETHRLNAHRDQVFRYWRGSSDVTSSRPAPPYAALCSFRLFEVWEPGRYPNEPRATFTLEQLPDRYETLLFLAGVTDEPLFGTQRELTRHAAGIVALLYQQLVERQAAAPETLRTFLMQLVWCLFAEDLAMLEGHPVQRIIETLVRHPDRSSYVELGALFDILNDPTDYGRHGLLKGTRYVNGALFAAPAKVHLEADELALLVRAAEFDWRKVDPTIFGSLMEGCLGHDRRWALGAHYTHEVDILKIVRPTIVAPWRARINATTTPAEARQALDELCEFRCWTRPAVAATSCTSPIASCALLSTSCGSGSTFSLPRPACPPRPGRCPITRCATCTGLISSGSRP